MVDRKQMHAILLGLCGLIFGTACASRPAPFTRDGEKMRSDRPAPFKPAKTYPEWAYDAPSYTRPVDEPKSEPKSRVKDPEHFFTSKPVIMVHKPEGYVAEEIPRVAIWYTHDNGYHWKKAGYFGRSATYFPLQVTKEGDYGIRFVGPGQEAAMETPPNPVCVHHVDMTPPKVKLSIDPEQAWYTLGQRITINWNATDPHLEAMPARVSVIPDWASNPAQPIEIAREQPEVGSIDYVVSSSLMGDGFRIRVDAIDRAGNIGLAYSQTLQIEPDRMDGGARPPVRTIQYGDAGSNTTDSQVKANVSPPPMEVQSTPAVSSSGGATGGGEMLPLEEIPVSGSTLPVKDATPSPSMQVPDDSTPANVEMRAEARPAARVVAPSNVATSAEPLPLLPLGAIQAASTPIQNAQPATPTQAEVDPQFDQTIVRDAPSDVTNVSDALPDEPEAVEEKSLIRPASVTQEHVVRQSQASHQQDVECDSVEDASAVNGAEADSQDSDTEAFGDDEANAGSLSGWRTISAPEVVDSSSQHRTGTFGKTLASGWRAAEAAVERLLAGFKDSNGVTAAELVRGADVMVGGGLAAPMPATVRSLTRAPATQPPHAWRTLATRSTRRGGEVWSLPRPALNFELPRLFAREAFGASRGRVDLSAENSAASGSRIRVVAVSSDPE